MKYPSQLVFAPLPPTGVIQHTVNYDPRSDHGGEESALQPRVALHRYKQDLIYARLVNKNTSLELQRYILDSSDSSNNSLSTNKQSPVISINYSTAIASDIVFVNGDQGLYCWIVSVDGQLIRHKFQVDKLFATTNTVTTNLDSIVRPIKSFMNSQLVSFSVTASGVATIAFDDGSLVHIQDLELHNAPTSREGLNIIYKDDAVCEYQIHELSTFAPFVLLRRVGGMVGWKGSASSTQVYVSALASGDRTTLGVLQDHQLSIWKDLSSGTNPKLLELPRFDDAHQRLMDTEEQDLTCQFPGSFNPSPLSNHHEQEAPLINDSHTPEYLIRISSCGSVAIIFVGAKNSPYFAIYDMESNRFLRVVMLPCSDHDQQPLQFAGSVKDNVLRLWVVWAKHEKQWVLSTVDVSISSANTNDLVTNPDWQQMLSYEDAAPSSPVDILLLGSTQLMMATIDTLSAARDLDQVDAAFLQHSSIDDFGCETVLSTLSSISDTLNTNARGQLETQLRSCFPQGSPEEFYKQHGLKDVIIGYTPSLDKNDIGKLLSLMVPDDASLPAEHAQQHIGTMMQTLIISATSQIVNTRFNIAFSLLTLLAHAVYGDGDSSLTELMLSTWELLRTLDALRWLESEGNDMRQVYPVVLKENSWDIGEAAYHRVATLAKPDMLIEIADMLAVQGDTERAIALTRLFLDNNQLTMAMGGKKGDTVRAVQCRGYLANKEFDHAVEVLQQVTDPAMQNRLLDDLLDRAYTSANYDFICKRLQPLGVSRVGDCIRQKAENQQPKVDTDTAQRHLSWWELGYSFYALANHMEQAYACMRLHMEQTGNKDNLLKEFFSNK